MRYGWLIALVAAICLTPFRGQAADSPKVALAISLREDADAAFQAKDAQQAESYLRQSLALDPDSDLIRAKLSISLLAQSRVSEAVAALSDVAFVWGNGPEADYINEAISLVSSAAVDWETGWADSVRQLAARSAPETDWLSPLAPELARLARATPIRRERPSDCLVQARLAALLERGGQVFKPNAICASGPANADLYTGHHIGWLSLTGRPEEAVIVTEELQRSVREPSDGQPCTRAPGPAMSNLAGYSPALVERVRKAGRAACQSSVQRALLDAADRAAHREFLKLAWAAASAPPWRAATDQDRANTVLSIAYMYGEVRVIRSLMLAKGLQWDDGAYVYLAAAGLLGPAQEYAARYRSTGPHGALIQTANRVNKAQREQVRRIVIEGRPLGALSDWPVIPDAEDGTLQKIDTFVTLAIQQFGLPEAYRSHKRLTSTP